MGAGRRCLLPSKAINSWKELQGRDRFIAAGSCVPESGSEELRRVMAKIAKTADRQKVMDTSKSTDCPKCNKPTRIVKRVKDRERGVPGGVYISCSGCDFYEKL
jgi:RNase P subunit RPR2